MNHYTVDVKNNENDIIINLETMNYCQGSCSGCLFNSNERKNGSFLNKDKINKAFDEIQNLFKHYEETYDTINSFTLILGQGDHMILSENDIEFLFNKIKLINRENLLVITTISGITKKETFNSKIDLFYTLSVKNNVNLFFAFVLDPKKFFFNKFTPIYLDNMTYVRNKFGVIDLTINLGIDIINHLSPDDLHKFLTINQFRHIELNLVPTLETSHLFTEQWDNIIKWLSDFTKISQTQEQYKTHYIYINQYYYNYHFSKKIMELQNILQKQLYQSLYIDRDLNVYSMQVGGLGNGVPYSKRFGYEPIFNLSNYSLQELKDKTYKQSITILRDYQKDKSCITCPYNRQCLMSGFNVLRKTIKQEKCFLSIDKMYDEIDFQQTEACFGVNYNFKPRGTYENNELEKQFLDKITEIKLINEKE